MFGLLKGASCAMDPGARRQWTGHICGVCQGLSERYGPLTRLATNYDAALLSVMVEAQTPQPQARRFGYCPLRRPVKAEVVAAGSPGVEYAASVAMMIAASKVRDRLQDSQGGLRIARRAASSISARWMTAARQTAAALGLDAAAIDSQIGRQAIVEAQPNQDFYFYAMPTELAVAAAFGHTAILAGRPHNAQILHDMGRMFGRIMLLVDSYQDYAADLKAHSFNALAAAFGGGEWRQQASRIFHQAYATLRKGFGELDLSHPALPHALLVRGLEKRGHRALQLCATAAAGCHPLGARTAVARSTDQPDGGYWPEEAQEPQHEVGQEGWEPDGAFGPSAEPCGGGGGDCCCRWCAYSNCDCSDCDSSGCDCSNCDCGNCCEGGSCCNCCDCNC